MERRSKVYSFIVLAVGLVLPAGCDRSQESCRAPGYGVLLVSGPQTVVAVHLDGEGCVDASVECVGTDFVPGTQESGCTNHWIRPNRAGECFINVELAEGGRWEHTVTFHLSEGPCGPFQVPADEASVYFLPCGPALLCPGPPGARTAQQVRARRGAYRTGSSRTRWS